MGSEHSAARPLKHRAQDLLIDARGAVLDPDATEADLIVRRDRVRLLRNKLATMKETVA